MRKFVALVCILAMLFAVTEAYAWSERAHGHFRYHNGRYERAGSVFGWIVAGVAIGTVVASIAPSREVLYVRDTPYYFYDGVYYTQCPRGYVVVPDPTITPGVVVATPTVPAEQLLIEIPNKNGSYTTITLRRTPEGYVGPQGELYREHPTVEQLKVLYGK